MSTIDRREFQTLLWLQYQRRPNRPFISHVINITQLNPLFSSDGPKPWQYLLTTQLQRHAMSYLNPAFPNEYTLRTVADVSSKPCFVCHKPTTKVLTTVGNKVCALLFGLRCSSLFVICWIKVALGFWFLLLENGRMSWRWENDLRERDLISLRLKHSPFVTPNFLFYSNWVGVSDSDWVEGISRYPLMFRTLIWMFVT